MSNFKLGKYFITNIPSTVTKEEVALMIDQMAATENVTMDYNDWKEQWSQENTK